MSVQLQIEESTGYLIARFIGDGEWEEVWGRFEFITKECQRVNRNKVLIDFTSAFATITFVDRYFLGENAVVFARFRIKVGSLARADQIDNENLAEVVARNRGVDVRTFTDVRKAEAWLLG